MPLQSSQIKSDRPYLIIRGMENSNQIDLFPNEKRKPSGKSTPEFVARFQVKGYSSPPRYKRLKVTDWSKRDETGIPIDHR